jgi:D-ribulokinase
VKPRYELVIGIDIGTQGVRGVAVDTKGHVAAEAGHALETIETYADQFEQRPEEWWFGVQSVLKSIMQQLSSADSRLYDVRAIAVSGTSGTVLLIDEKGRPLTNAIMYHDRRCQAVVPEVQEALAEQCACLGYRVSSSFGITKLVWLIQNYPNEWDAARYVVHSSDFVTGMLTGIWGVSDHTSALKTGYDLVNDKWPIPAMERLHLDFHKLPRVVTPGEPVGYISGPVASDLGLPMHCVVVAGLTDGCAAQVASGAVHYGEWNSSLGTTWTLKGNTPEIQADPLGRVYNHKGYNHGWLPGAASNTGTRWIGRMFPQVKDYKRWDRLAAMQLPSELIVYPLNGRGERFPFIHANAESFTEGSAKLNGIDLYAAYLQGFALVERIGFEEIERLGMEVGDKIFVTGGAALSKEWLQIRSNVLQRFIVRPQNANSAKGAAVIAGMYAWHKSVEVAAMQMTSFDLELEPENCGEVWTEKVWQMRNAFRQRGWL